MEWLPVHAEVCVCGRVAAGSENATKAELVEKKSQIIARGTWELRIRNVGTPARTHENRNGVACETGIASASGSTASGVVTAGVAANDHSLT